MKSEKQHLDSLFDSMKQGIAILEMLCILIEFEEIQIRFPSSEGIHDLIIKVRGHPLPQANGFQKHPFQIVDPDATSVHFHPADAHEEERRILIGLGYILPSNRETMLLGGQKEAIGNQIRQIVEIISGQKGKNSVRIFLAEENLVFEKRRFVGINAPLDLMQFARGSFLANGVFGVSPRQ